MDKCRFFTLTGIFLLSVAATQPARADATVQVQQVDPDLDVSSLAQKGVEIHKAQNSPSPEKSSSILGVHERNSLLESAGLLAQTHSMDDADKDVLILRAKHYSPERLQKSYPSLNPSSLTKLHQLLVRKSGANPGANP
jgi:hypothetical protein